MKTCQYSSLFLLSGKLQANYNWKVLHRRHIWTHNSPLIQPHHPHRTKSDQGGMGPHRRQSKLARQVCNILWYCRVPYPTRTSLLITLNLDQSSQPNPTTPVINRDATVPGPSRSCKYYLVWCLLYGLLLTTWTLIIAPTMTPTDQLIIESTILNQDEEDIFGTSNPPSPTTTASPTRAQQRSSRKGKQRAEQADANAESSKRKRRWL